MRATNTTVEPWPLPAHDRASDAPGAFRLSRRRLAAALLLALAPIAAQAAAIVVTSPDDSDPAAAGTCTLRQAIVSMNTGALAGGCANTGAAFGSADTITFAASSLAGNVPGTITLGDSADTSGNLGGTLVVTAPHLVIDGSEWRGDSTGQYADGVTITRPAGAGNAFGILRDTAAAGGLLVLNGIAMRNGYALQALCGGRGDGGGVCMIDADLVMTDSRVSGNQAGYGGGGIASVAGTIMLTRCTIDANVGYLGGGIRSRTGSVTLASSTLSGNGEWAVSHGGGIHAGGPLVVVDSTISGNTGKLGAGIQSGDTTNLTRSLVAGNQAYYSGGGIHVLAGGMIEVTGSTIDNNSARYVGGGVYAEGGLAVVNGTIAGNGGSTGGGIFLAATATLDLDHATLSLNHANGSGGGIGSTAGATATIVHSIVSGNSQGAGSDIDLDGGWAGSGNLVSDPGVALGPLQDNGGATPTMLPGPGSAATDAIAPQDCTRPADQRGIARPQGAGCDIGAVEVVVDAIFADGFDAAAAAPDRT